MKPSSTVLCALLLVVGASCVRQLEQASDHQATVRPTTFVGQLLLPSGTGSRGVEVRIVARRSGQPAQTMWVLFDEQGRFEEVLQGQILSMEVVAGLESTVHRIETKGLPTADAEGQINVGAIDLRDSLTKRSFKVLPADGVSSGVVRIAMWSGRPTPGVVLGSRQFPPVPLGSDLDWLVSSDAQDTYFLVEHPTTTIPQTKWWDGKQQLFGPYTLDNFPTELRLE